MKKFIKINYDNPNVKNMKMSQEELEKIIPTDIHDNRLDTFYDKNRLSICHSVIDVKNKREFCFDRFGAYPSYDYGKDGGLIASGEYSKLSSKLTGQTYDIFIEEKINYIVMTDDYKNYVVVPEGVKIPNGDPRDHNNKQFHEFYIPINYLV